MRIIEVMGCAFSDRDHLDVGGVLVSLRKSDMFTFSVRDNQAKPSRQACLSARRRRLLRERFGSAKTKHEVRKSFDFQLARSICSLSVNAICLHFDASLIFPLRESDMLATQARYGKPLAFVEGITRYSFTPPMFTPLAKYFWMKG